MQGPSGAVYRVVEVQKDGIVIVTPHPKASLDRLILDRHALERFMPFMGDDRVGP